MAPKPAWRSVKISERRRRKAKRFATVDQATIVVVEQPKFSLEAAADTVNVVRSGTAAFQVAISRADGFSEPLRFTFGTQPV